MDETTAAAADPFRWRHNCRRAATREIRAQNALLHLNPAPNNRPRLLEKDITLLSALWPMLAACIQHAGVIASAGNEPPAWVNRVIDITLRYTPYLKEAAARGLLPAEAIKWTGLSEIAHSKAKTASVVKAKKLLALWEAVDVKRT